MGNELIRGIAGSDIGHGHVIMRGDDGKFYPVDRGHPWGVAVEPIKNGETIVSDGNFAWHRDRK